MRIEISFFASHRDVVGSDQISLITRDGADIASVAAILGEKYPELKRLLGHSRPAVNEEYTTLNHELKEGDRLAFIPPVSGG